jgi:hypothetical protein
MPSSPLTLKGRLMRITHLRINTRLLGLFVLFYLGISFFLPVFVAQDEPTLSIEVDDTDTGLEIDQNITFEGKSYTIFVNVEDEEEPIFAVIDANVSVLGKQYTTSENLLYITIQAPAFEDRESFIITAAKQGYTSVERELTVMKGQLQLTMETTVEEKKELQVTVTDQNSNPIANAYVYLTAESTPVITDALGIAYLTAPEVDQNTNYELVVKKNGYLNVTGRIRVQQQSSLLDFFNTQFFQLLPIVFAVVIVLCAILYVRFRKQKNQQMPPVRSEQKPSSDQDSLIQKEHLGRRIEKESTLYSLHDKKNVSVSAPDPRVEEIRIPAQEKKKETTILSEEKPQKQTTVDKKVEGDEWFKGQDYMRYKLDELTGQIDEKTDGKWFEGQHDSKYKVNETLKISTKKKKTDEDDSK